MFSLVKKMSFSGKILTLLFIIKIWYNFQKNVIECCSGVHGPAHWCALRHRPVLVREDRKGVDVAIRDGGYRPARPYRNGAAIGWFFFLFFFL